LKSHEGLQTRQSLRRIAHESPSTITISGK